MIIGANVNAMDTFFSRGPTVVWRVAALIAAAACGVFSIGPALAACPANLGGSQTAASFVVKTDGTVGDYATGLIWKRCVEGQSGAGCSGVATVMTWATALTAARNSSFAGFSDWRLPNKQELESIVDASCTSPALNTTLFPGLVSGWTWTGTTVPSGPTTAWAVNVAFGHVAADLKTGSSNTVRLVRAGRSFDALSPMPPQVLNVDGSDLASRYTASGDAAMLIRYLTGMRGAALTAGAIGNGATRDATQIALHLENNLSLFDVDQDGQVLASTDGLMILRRMLGLRGAAITAGVKNSSRSDFDIQTAIDALMP